MYLEHVAENAKHAMEVVELGVATFTSLSPPLYTGHHLGDEHKINDQRRSQK